MSALSFNLTHALWPNQNMFEVRAAHEAEARRQEAERAKDALHAAMDLIELEEWCDGWVFAKAGTA